MKLSMVNFSGRAPLCPSPAPLDGVDGAAEATGLALATGVAEAAGLFEGFCSTTAGLDALAEATADDFAGVAEGLLAAAEVG